MVGALGATLAFGQAVTIQPPNLSAALAGTLAGTAAVSLTGASTYAIPLAVPPGTQGIEPALSLSYSSQADRGLLGHGWSLSGLSGISRCPRTLVQDGVSGAVTLTATDQFCLDGQRLLLVSGTHGATAEYRTQTESFSKVTSSGSNTAKGPDSWQVYTKAGLILTFGGTADSTIEAAGRSTVLTWAVSRVRDRRGNYYDVGYSENNATGEYYPSRIRYTGNTTTGLVPYHAINFVYEARPDPWQGYVAGTVLSSTQRLTNVRAYINTVGDGSGGTLVHDYRIGYVTNATNGRSLVRTVSDCDGSGNCLPSTTFSWSSWNAAGSTFAAAGSGNWGGPAVTFQTVNSTNGSKEQQVQTNVLLGDFNGDGAGDLLSANGAGQWNVCFGGTGTAFNCQSWPGPAAPVKQVMTGDFNGDGRTDLAVPPVGGATNWNICLSTGSGFSCSTWSAKSVGQSPNSYLIADFTGDGRDDIIALDRFSQYGGSALCPSVGNGFAACTPYNATTFIDLVAADPEVGIRVVSRNFADFNGDGRADVFLSYHDGAIHAWYVNLATDTGLTYTSGFGSTGGQLIPNVGATRNVDQNSDPYGSYADIVGYANGLGTSAQVCRSTGVSLSCSPIAGTDNTNSSGGLKFELQHLVPR